MFWQSIGHRLLGAVNFLIARPIYLGGNRSMVVSRFADRFFVDTRDRSVGQTLMSTRTWETEVTRALRRLLRPGLVVADVGANLGWHTVRMARAVGASGRIHAFEPHPDMVALLGRNVQINNLVDRVLTVPKAVFSSTGQLTLHAYAELMGGSSAFGSAGTAAKFHDEVREIDVQCVTLDDYFAPGSKVDVIHADVEGAEPHVVRGARRVIAENPGIALVLEYSPEMLASSGISISEFNDELRGMGFSPSRILRSGRLARTTYEELAAGGHCDVVFRR